MLEIKRIVTGELEENTYIVYKNGIGVVIDPGYAPERIISFAKENKIDVKYILLTHSHFDHIGSVPEVKEALGAKVFCSEEEKPLLMSGDLNLSSVYAENIEIEPDGTFSDGETLAVGEQEFRFMLTPGHTKGSAVIFCENNVFTGDTLFSDGYGRTDLPTGNWRELLNSLKKLRVVKGEYRLFSGHGEEGFLKGETE